MIVNRGPQSVQVMKGCRYLRSSESNNSVRHEWQVAWSGGTSVRAPSPPALATITNPGAACSTRGTDSDSTPDTIASGGASSRSRRLNSAIAAALPCTSAKTARASLPTKPLSPNSVASRCTKGRKPTPCTTPVTMNRRRPPLVCSAGGFGAAVISDRHRCLGCSHDQRTRCLRSVQFRPVAAVRSMIGVEAADVAASGEAAGNQGRMVL